MLKSLFGKNKEKKKTNNNNSENKLLNYYNEIILKAKENSKNIKCGKNYLADTYGNNEKILNLILQKLNQKLNIENNSNFFEDSINFCVICLNTSCILPIPERMSEFSLDARELFAEALIASLTKNGIKGFYRYEDSIFYRNYTPSDSYY